MIRNLFIAALCAAFCAGLVTSLIQAQRLTPMIFAAEAYEGAGEDAHVHDEGEAAMTDAVAAEEHAHSEDEWMPQDGFERTAFTIFANIIVGAGYALVLGAVALAANLPINARSGLLWGLAGFAAFTLAPSFGLAPGLPTMPIADTFARQIWWGGTALATGAGLLLIAKTQTPWAIGVAVLLFVAPHLIGAPQAPAGETGVPASLAASFAAAVLVNGLVFFVVLGTVFGWVADRLGARDAAMPTLAAGRAA